MRRALSNLVCSARSVRPEKPPAPKATTIRRRLAIEALEPRVVLANVAPVAVDDTLYFDGFVERNLALGREAATHLAAGDLWYSSTDGSDQNALNPEWKAGPAAGFDPASGNEIGWTSTPQPTKFGFGDGNETTPVPAGHTTYYFFRPFDVLEETSSRLRLSILRDDCAAIYINGREVYRTSTLPFGAGNDTYCTAAVPTVDENSFFEHVVESWYADLRPTGNTIAVEVHQATPTSSDLGFDLELQNANVGLLANDYDPDGPHEQLTVEIVDASAAEWYGTLEVSPNGDVVYMPYNPWNGGSFSFTYRVRDNAQGDPQVSNIATAFVAMRVCDCAPPTASDDIDIPQFVTPEDTELTIDAESGPSGPHGVGVLANDGLVYWTPVYPIVVSQPTSGGTVAFDGSTGGFTYAPGRDFAGVDSFQYVLFDGYSQSDAATVEIVVAPVDDPPVAVDDRYTVGAGQTLHATLGDPGGVLANDHDVDGDPIESATLVSGSGPFTGTLMEFDPDGTFAYTPHFGFSGTDLFQYTVTANGITSEPATVKIVVLPDDRMPVANDDTYHVPPFAVFATTAQNGVLSNDVNAGGVLISDPAGGVTLSGPEGTLTWLNVVRYGDYAISDGSFQFTPAAGEELVAFVTEYTAIDPDGDTDQAWLIVHVGEASFDLNGDGAVDRADLALAVAHYGMPTGANSGQGDLSGDGRVGLTDMVILRNHLTLTPPPTAAAAVVRTVGAKRLNASVVDQTVVGRGVVASGLRGARNRSHRLSANTVPEFDAKPESTDEAQALRACRLRATALPRAMRYDLF